VIGAGLAGAAAARALAERSIDVDVLDAGDVASGGSGAPRAVLAPHIASWSSPQCRVVAQAFLHARAVLKRVAAPLETCGLLQALHEDDAWGHEQAVHEWGWPKDALEIVDSADAALLAGTSIGGRPAVWVAEACVTQPALAVRALLDHPRIRVHQFTSVDTLHQTNDGWALVTRGAGAERAPQFAPVVVIATAGAWTPVHSYRNDAEDDDNAAVEIDRTAPLASSALSDVPFEQTRGQLTMIATTDDAPLAVVRSGGYVLPPHAGSLCVGATHDRDCDDLSPTTHDDAQNLETLDRLLPGSREANTVPDRTARWVGLRATVNDRCPVVGAVPDFNAFRAAFAALRHGPIAQEWPPAPVVPGLFVTLAHGSRGTSTALLAGELLADIVTGSPRCVADDLLPAILPQRFLVRALRRSEGGSVP
jgi:tRNA 5-methylaminomethyl-2-thiouridine biosynthesis bifunctional protein